MPEIEVSPLRADELQEAFRICRVAFGTFLGVPDPSSFSGDRNFIASRWRADNTAFLAARVDGRLIGSNVVTRWGSFGFFGPLTVLPEFWDQGVAQRLLERTMEIFEQWGVRHTGLYTFAHSAKHMALYQKFGYWPRYLTTIMSKSPGPAGAVTGTTLSELSGPQLDKAIRACRELTDAIDPGLDVTAEIRLLLTHGGGETLLLWNGGQLDAFAICHMGPGSEGGSALCYAKFAAARSGAGAEERLGRLLEACESFAAARGLPVEAGVNLAREETFRRMRGRGYRTVMQGVAMHRPHAPGFNHPEAYVIDDWR